MARRQERGPATPTDGAPGRLCGAHAGVEQFEELYTLAQTGTRTAPISLYWFTGCIGASFWPYWARVHRAWPIPDGGPIAVPTGYAAFPTEIVRPPRSLAERTYRDIRRWTAMHRGGHFAAMEQPEALAREVLAFLRSLRPSR